MKLRPKIEDKANNKQVKFNPSIFTHQVQDGYFEMRSNGLSFSMKLKESRKSYGFQMLSEY